MSERTIKKNPKKVDVLIVNDEADTPSLLNPMSGQIFVTNPVGKRVIELADGAQSVEDITTQITREFKGTSRDSVRRDISGFLRESTEKGLITWTEV